VVNDLYSILGVAQTATAAEVKERFRFLSHAYHPDKFPTETQRRTAEEQFKRVNEAYRILSDPGARARYDEARGERPGAPPRAAYQRPTTDAPPAAKRAGFWRIIKVIGLGTAVLVGVAAFVIYEADRRQRVEFEASKHRIASSEIELGELQFKLGDVAGSYYLGGRVRNRSPQYTLDTVVLKLTIADILPSGSSEIVGQEDVYIMARIPPGQARHVSAWVRFENLPKPLGRYDWSYAITEIRGK
jgi:curved DNA-binding protein CbpA